MNRDRPVRPVRRVLRLRGRLSPGGLRSVLRGDARRAPGADPRDWVVMFSGIAWPANGDHRQHALARELAAERRVLFVDPPGLRPRWSLTVRPVAASVWHAVPPTVLPLGRMVPPFNRANRRIAAALLRRWLDRRPASRLLWIDEDLAYPAAGRLGEDAVVYDATDLDWTFARRWNRRHARSGLRKSVGAADLVLASSSVLPQWLPASRRPPVIVPNGCDPDRFSADGCVARWITRLPGPRLVYAGSIDSRAFDAELVAAVARRRPDWTFLLVGRSAAAARAVVAGLRNVHLTGPVPFENMPAVLRAADVCLIPYRVGGLIDYVQPKKLYEYLAVGKPVVATPLPSLTLLHDLVHLGSTAEEFAKGVEEALESAHCPAVLARLRRAAELNSWSVRGEQVRSLLKQLEGTAR